MADLDDEAITVTIPADGGEGQVTEVKLDGDGKKVETNDDPITDLKGQFEALKGQLGQTTQRLVGAERQLQAKDQELADVRKEVTSSQLDTVLSGIQAAEAEATTAEKEFIAAAEAGDFAAQARAQRKISSAEARIQRLKEAEGDLKEVASAKPAPRQETRQQPSADPVEQFTKGMSARSAAWIRSHPDCVTDPKKNSRMLAAHNLALADDIPVDSDEYFERIEAGIASSKAAKAEQKSEPSKVNIRPSAPVAPAGNASGGMNGGGQTVTLTRREVQAATDGSLVHNFNDPNGKFKKGDVIGVQEMARRKAIMMRQGHYDKNYTE